MINWPTPIASDGFVNQMPVRPSPPSATISTCKIEACRMGRRRHSGGSAVGSVAEDDGSHPLLIAALGTAAVHSGRLDRSVDTGADPTRGEVSRPLHDGGVRSPRRHLGAVPGAGAHFRLTMSV